jgi:hypothetical protein
MSYKYFLCVKVYPDDEPVFVSLDVENRAFTIDIGT